jgi:2-amino-4-hydroxy-6-hydroxymethyldihydropteridine diphosphokinase
MTHAESVFLGLGANVGPARVALERAVAAVSALPGASLTGVSRLYRTRPVGVLDQPDFLNAVVALRLPRPGDPEGSALALLEALKGIERGLGRLVRRRWGPREVDVDLLLYGDHVIRTERTVAARGADPGKPGADWLEVPHAAASERLFVLAPWAELAPDLRPPGWRLSIAEARDRAIRAEGADAVRVVAAWDPRTGGWLGPDEVVDR